MKTLTLLPLVMLLQLPGLKAQGQKLKTISMQEAKLSCKLTTPELQLRKKTVVAELKIKLLERTETENGYKYKFDGSDDMLDLLNNFIKTERLCCDFFTFSLTVASDSKFSWLELSGPEGTKDFIRQEIEF